MNGFVTKTFDRWANKLRLSDDSLCVAFDEMARGLVDANLGGNLYKKRIAAFGRGKSGSFRTLVAFRSGDKAIFIYGFAKNERANIDDREERALKALAKELLAYSPRAIAMALKAGALRKLRCSNE